MIYLQIQYHSQKSSSQVPNVVTYIIIIQSNPRGKNNSDYLGFSGTSEGLLQNGSW